MNKQITTIIIGIFLISLASAIYPGECETIDFPFEGEVNFTLISNTSSMEVLNWSKDGDEITYCFPTNLAPGNYSFGWGSYEDSPPEPTIVHHYSSGGSGSDCEVEYRDRNITQYIGREPFPDDTISTVEIVADTDSCEEQKDIAPLIFGLVIFCIISALMVIILCIKQVKGKKEQQEEPEEEEQEVPEEETSEVVVNGSFDDLNYEGLEEDENGETK